MPKPVSGDVSDGSERRQTVRGGRAQPQAGEPENLPCPRCDSTNTKFCYYNNYNLSQPRYFCKSCRRYWTRGGTLRNIPVGGGPRKKSKRPRATSSSATPLPPPPTPPPAPDVTLDLTSGSSFTSLLTSNAVSFLGGRDQFTDNGFGDVSLQGYDYGYGYGYGKAAGECHMIGNEPQLTGSNGGEGGVLSANAMDGEDYFIWSDLAISTNGKALK